MRLLLLGLLTTLVACKFAPTRTGDDVAGDDDPDAGGYVLPAPVLIPGGGVTDGPIVAGLNVVVIDLETNAPIANAMVSVGAFQGMTSVAGVFVADASLVGKQTVLASAAGYRTGQWIGVNGANVTIPLAPLAMPSGSASGVINNFGSFAINPSVGHSRRGTIGYSTDDRESITANDLDTPGGTDQCTGATCNYQVRSRLGTVSLLAIITDRFDNGTGNPFDDSETVLGYAFKSGVTISNGVDNAGQNLDPIPPGNLNNITIDYGTPPTETLFAVSVVGIELSATESLPIPIFVAAAIPAPTLSAIPGATSYRLTALAFSVDGITAAIRRGSSSTTLAVGTWLEAPQNVVATVTETTFGVIAGANIYSVLYRDEGIDTDLFEATIFDDTTTVTLPAGITVPTTNLDVTVQGIRSTIDVTDFGFDADANKVDDASFRTIDVN